MLECAPAVHVDLKPVTPPMTPGSTSAVAASKRAPLQPITNVYSTNAPITAPHPQSRKARKRERRKVARKAAKKAAKERTTTTHAAAPLDSESEMDGVFPLTFEYIKEPDPKSPEFMDIAAEAAMGLSVATPDIFAEGSGDDYRFGSDIETEFAATSTGGEVSHAITRPLSPKISRVRDSQLVFTPPILVERLSVATSTRYELAEVHGGSPAFRHMLDALVVKLERAIHGFGCAESNRFLFRDFAGHFALAINRYGLNPDTPPASEWVLPLVLPWLRPAELPASECADKVFGEVCGWTKTLCRMIGGTELLQSSAWDSLADALTAPEASAQGEYALQAALTILSETPLSYAAVCKVVLLRHVTLGFDSPNLAPFRRRRLELMAKLVTAAVEVADIQALNELGRELEHNRVTEDDQLALNRTVELIEKVQEVRTHLGYEERRHGRARFSVYSLKSMKSFKRHPEECPSSAESIRSDPSTPNDTSLQSPKRISLRSRFRKLLHWRRRHRSDRTADTRSVASLKLSNTSGISTATSPSNVTDEIYATVSDAAREFAVASFRSAR